MGIVELLFISIGLAVGALVVGITFAFLKVNILVAILSIGIIMFILSIVGVKTGNKFGNKWKKSTNYRWPYFNNYVFQNIIRRFIIRYSYIIHKAIINFSQLLYKI